MSSARRYDIDWIRVIAIGLLLIYHVAIGFQAWGIMIGFITNDRTWDSLWVPMTMLNVWRIPLLFFVSGMGVYYALRNRSWKQLLAERAGRILLPFLFGAVAIVPIHVYLWQRYYHLSTGYAPNPAHLWFLGNIFVYVVVLSPLFFFLKRNENGRLARAIKWVMSNPLGILLVMAAFIVEAWILDPRPYEMYAMTWHGFFLGLLAFLAGFCFVLSGDGFWQMIKKWRWLFLLTAAILFTLRLIHFTFNTPYYLLVTESHCWIISVFAFGYTHLNRPGKALRYLSEAAYPIYILHMIFLYTASWLIFPLDVAVPLQFVMVLLFTGVGCFAVYELVIRRVNLIRPLFGLKRK